MNDDNKTVNQNANPVAPADQTQSQATVQPVQPSGPIGSANKEVGPNLSEFVRPVGPETSPNLTSEVSESGVKVESGKPDLTPEHQELGVGHAGPHVPVPSSPSGEVSLPMSEEEMVDKLKTGQDDDSGKWLAGLIRKIMKVLGL